MKKKTKKPELRLLLATLLFILPVQLDAQSTVTEAADPGHAAGALHRTLFGNGYRDTWVVPITVPVLDLGTFAGGLTPFREGGNQSRTLRFQAGNGKVYQFRSARKFLPRSMPDDLQDTPAGDLVHDQSSAMHPTGHLVVSRLQQAAGIVHSVPQLVALPDDPRLGKFRETFAGLIGQIEERPQDYDDNESLNFAKAEKIEDPDDLLEELEESLENRIDQRAYLRARLMDILIGDTDRGADQWAFARFERDGTDVYVPIPRDRDYAFMNSDGWLVQLIAIFYKKLVVFGDKFDSLSSYLFMTREFDRSHLTELSWADWDAVITDLTGKLTDQVIDDAVMQMPTEHRQLDGPKFASALKQRRNNLRDYARKYYYWVNEEAVVFAADEDERADVERNADGSVTVRLFREGNDARPAWERKFVPDETTEIRIFMERGNDRVLVHGRSETSIDVRIIGGEGNDVLVDSSSVGRGTTTWTTFYDVHGQNNIVTGPHSRVTQRPYATQPPSRLDRDEEKMAKNKHVLLEERRGRYQDQMNTGAGFIEQKTVGQFMRDWGQNKGFVPAFEMREGSGIIIGGGYQSLDFGFRRLPYETRWDIVGMVSPTTGRLGGQFTWDRHPENSRWSYSLFARGTQFESNRFYGFGNDTPDLDVSTTLVRRDEVVVYPSLNYALGSHSFISFGPVFKWNHAHVEEGSPADLLEPFGTTESVSQLGGHVEAFMNTAGLSALPRGGFVLNLSASSYPATQDITDAFHEANAMAATYLSFGMPVLALRVGAKHVWGDVFPLHEAAFLGGYNTLRGYRWNRFTGNAAAFGGADFRLPITRAVLFTRGNLGLQLLADAGRVWTRDPISDELTSAGDWHIGYGGGVWFETIGQLLTLSYAKGDDEGRVYFKLGKPF
jgi:hypothetical protein